MKTLTAGALAAIASGNVAIVHLVLMQFPSGTVALNTSNWDLVWGGVTYKGAYGLGGISAINDGGGEVKGISLSLDGGPGAMIALALDGADEVQGTPLSIRVAMLDSATYTIQDAPIAWAGTLDTMSISEDGDQATVTATAESKAVDLLRGTPMTYSDADQQAAYPGDRSMEYIVDQAGKPIVWPSREYFLK